jgi:hypothetical protein
LTWHEPQQGYNKEVYSQEYTPPETTHRHYFFLLYTKMFLASALYLTNIIFTAIGRRAVMRYSLLLHGQSIALNAALR